MVVVDYSIHNRFRRFDYDPGDEQNQQQPLDPTVDAALANFCPRLQKSVSLLARHTVGESVISYSNGIQRCRRRSCC